MTWQDRRQHRLRRDLNDLVRSPDGHVSEAKVWSNVGKGATAWLLLWHTNALIDHPDSLLILLLVLIMPDLIKRVIASKYPIPTGNGK